MQPRSPAAEVWLVDVDANGRQLDDLGDQLCLLPQAEQARLAAIPDASARQCRRRAHVALRALLAVHLGLEPARSVFAVSASGKPVIGCGSEVDFSLSHSGSLALAGIIAAGSIGVDVETRSAVDMDGRRRQVIEAAAQALTPDVHLPASGIRRFLQAWTRLEALAKASGLGIGALLARIGARGPAADLPQSDNRAALDALAGDLQVEDLALDPPAAAAVALPRGGRWTFRRFSTDAGDLADVWQKIAAAG